jgi:hypothetical protein
MSKKVRPYLKGQLDGLCGDYAIVNALRMLERVKNKDEATEALNLSIAELEFLCPLRERIFEGTEIGEIDTVMMRVVKRQYGVRISTPFRSRCAQIILKSFVLETRCFLREHQGVILTSIGGFHDHWT